MSHQLTDRHLKCQEASGESMHDYVPCEKPVVALVDNGDFHVYFMCEACTDHNVRNRRAQKLADVVGRELRPA